uniref:Uncharacterized protein n=1 Tax=Siphoviridae sp. ctREU2 TaxID=2826333 RepID=A0A8S5NIE5_9CAUD|nr:MAG TPA: hypothetical protein [Siphoviridae sp. ctREU2]
MIFNVNVLVFNYIQRYKYLIRGTSKLLTFKLLAANRVVSN